MAPAWIFREEVIVSLTRAAFIAIGITAVVLAPVAARTYPEHSVKIIVPFPAGGPLDVVARALADKLAAKLKQPFIVENKPGAGGNLGTDAVAKAAPDGHTLLLVLSTTLTLNPALYPKLPFDPAKDLRVLSLATKSSQLLVVHPSLPARTVKEFVEHARQEPIAYAHAGPGSPGHLMMELFRLQAGFKAIPVPYRGNSLLVTDLLAGQIKAGFVGSGGLFQHVRDGKVRALAISTPERSPLLADVPTIGESGYPDVKFGGYFVLAVPAATPDAIAAKIEREAREALQIADVKEKLRTMDIDTIATSSAEARALLEAEAEMMARVVKAANMRVQ
jgi:tripartite-type tricarboxylate transporter receptor subunit TctC